MISAEQLVSFIIQFLISVLLFPAGMLPKAIASAVLTGTHRTDTFYKGTRRDYVTDARGNTTSFTYDAMGRVTTTTYPDSVVTEGGVNPVTTYSHVGYDGLGRKIWES
ncbi:MAG: RHS repeat domain-containing protein, partial [Planctomycetota bacterium]